MAFNAALNTKIANLLSIEQPSDRTPGFYIYTGTDNVATTCAAGYFNGLAPHLVEGAMILAVCTDGFRLVVVTAVAAGVVTFNTLLGAVS